MKKMMLSRIGLSFQGLGELEEAFKWVSFALEINCENKSALFCLVSLASTESQYENVCGFIELFEKNDKDSDIQYSLAGMYFKLNDYTNSKKLLDQILLRDPYYEKAKTLKIEVISNSEGSVLSQINN